MDGPLERRTAARTAVVWDALAALALPTPADVVDVGGGTGGLAVRLARSGHRVTVVDPSPDALAALGRRATELGVAERVHGVQGDLGDLAGLVGDDAADLVLCHDVLGLVDDPAAAVRAVGEVLRPGGTFSAVVGQRNAVVLARAMAGHFQQALEALEPSAAASGAPAATPGERRFTAEEITDLLVQGGFDVQAVRGVRVFADLVPGSLLELEPGAAPALLELERAVCDRPEFLTLATALHVLAVR